jgi:hypothetical protein
MKKTTILLTLLLAFATAATAQNNFSDRTNNPVTPNNRGGANTLYSQEAAATGSTTGGLVSTRMTALGAGTDDTITADDFTVPSGQEWSVEGLLTSGFLSLGSATPTSFTVRFFADNGGSPGAEVYTWEGVPASGTNPDNQEFDFSGDPAVFGPGTYWVAVAGTHNTAINLGTFRWNWFTGPNVITNEFHLRDTAGFFGAPLDWTSASGLGVGDRSANFTLTGSSRALVPTLGEWGLIAFITLLAGSALIMARKRRLAV